MNKKYNNDFQDFIKEDKASAPSHLSSTILNVVHNDLKISPLFIFFKLVSIHSFVGMITLLFCPQFNFSLTNSYDLFHFFHKTFGHYACSAVCGVLFLGSGAIFATLILSNYEIHYIRKTKGLYHLFISTIFVGCFFFLSPKIYIDLATIWILGATLSSLLFIELGQIIKSKLHLA